MKITINKRLFMSALVCVMTSLTFLLPTYFKLQSASITRIILYVSLFIQVIFICLYCKKISKMSVLIIFLCLMRLLITITIGASLVTCLKSILLIIVHCLSLELIFQKKMEETFFKSYLIASIIFIIIFLVFLFKYPDGIPSVSGNISFYLFGNVNSTGKYILNTLFCISILGKEKFNKTLFIVLVVLSIGIYFFVYNSASSMITIVIFSIWYIALNKEMNIKRYIRLFLLCIFIFEVYIFTPEKFLNFSFISNIFKDNNSFSGREDLWVNAIYIIKKNLLFGRGLLSEEAFVSLVGNKYGSHNYLLDNLMQFGLFGTIPNLLIVLKPVTYICKNSTNVKIDYKTYIILGFCLSYMLLFLSEPIFSSESFIIPIFYLLNIKIRELQICNQEEDYCENKKDNISI